MTKADKVITETMMAETIAGFQAVLSELDAQVGQLKRDVAGKADSSTVEAVSKTVTTEVKIIKRIYSVLSPPRHGRCAPFRCICHVKTHPFNVRSASNPPQVLQ